jgi:hypothetical protein
MEFSKTEPLAASARQTALRALLSVEEPERVARQRERAGGGAREQQQLHPDRPPRYSKP